jgi:hypothetical protein
LHLMNYWGVCSRGWIKICFIILCFQCFLRSSIISWEIVFEWEFIIFFGFLFFFIIHYIFFYFYCTLAFTL